MALHIATLQVQRRKALALVTCVETRRRKETDMQQLFAHYYYGGKARGYEVRITRSPSLSPYDNENRVTDIPVSGKREARKVASQYNAKPWNF